MTDARVSIIVVPREGFSAAPGCLDRLFESTDVAFELTYVDAGSPPDVARRIRERAMQHRFQLVRTDGFLSPNQARNLGLTQAGPLELVVFLDNDVVPERGWLEAMVACARETGAAVVAPLYTYGPSTREATVHLARGHLEWFADDQGRKLRECHEHANADLGAVRPGLHRASTDFAEFHCVLVRREMLERLGGFDEGLLCAAEHIDFALGVRAEGGSLYFEPQARVHELTGVDLAAADLPYHQLRWSEAWIAETWRHFCAKWQLSPLSPLVVEQTEWMHAHRQSAIRFAEPGWPPGGWPAIAQSNVQLYNQLATLGFAANELQLVDRAYRLAVATWPNTFRACGKPQLNHLVGTASILAAHGQTAATVAAGLLHAMHAGADLDADTSDVERSRRQAVRQAAGPETEHIVLSFTTAFLVAAHRSASLAEVIESRLDSLSMTGVRCVAIDLARRLEEAAEADWRYAKRDSPAPETDDRLTTLLRACPRLGLAALGKRLESALARDASHEVPEPVLSNRATSFTVSPAVAPSLAASVPGRGGQPAG